MKITYRPWEPKSGMRRTFEELKQVWGQPERWSLDIRELVCQRGEPIEIRPDPYVLSNQSWYSAP